MISLEKTGRKQIKQIKRKEKDFQLKCEYNDVEGKMLITVETQKNLYKCLLCQNQLPKDLQMHLGCLENVFCCLCEQDHHDFDYQKQLVFIKTATQLKTKTITNVTSLKMVKQEKILQIKPKDKQYGELKIQFIELQQKQNIVQEENKKNSLMIQEQRILTTVLQQKINVLEKKFQEYQIGIEGQKKQKQLLGLKIQILQQKLSGIIEQKQKPKFTRIPFNVNKANKTASKYFIIKDIEHLIILNNNDGQNTQIMMNTIITKGQKYRVEFQVMKTLNSLIGVGLVDITKQFSQRSSSHSSNAICFWGQSGRVRYGPDDKCIDYGQFFGKNDTVTMDIFLDKSLIEWSINGVKRIQISPGILSQSDRRFVPYIEMVDFGDTIKWI